MLSVLLIGLREIAVNSIGEILEKVQIGENNRHYAETSMNRVSSRSHTIFRLIV